MKSASWRARAFRRGDPNSARDPVGHPRENNKQGSVALGEFLRAVRVKKGLTVNAPAESHPRRDPHGVGAGALGAGAAPGICFH